MLFSWPTVLRNNCNFCHVTYKRPWPKHLPLGILDAGSVMPVHHWTASLLIRCLQTPSCSSGTLCRPFDNMHLFEPHLLLTSSDIFAWVPPLTVEFTSSEQKKNNFLANRMRWNESYSFDTDIVQLFYNAPPTFRRAELNKQPYPGSDVMALWFKLQETKPFALKRACVIFGEFNLFACL